jgi:dihydrofolate reductase
MISRLYMAISANGAVATGQGDTPWGEASWNNFISETNAAGNLIIGRRTYDEMASRHEFALLDPGAKVVVVTKSPLKDSTVTAVADPQAARSAVAKLGFEVALWGGGPRLATSALQSGLLDEIWLDIEPVILGNGLPLVPADITAQLKLNDWSMYIGGITLKYGVEK